MSRAAGWSENDDDLLSFVAGVLRPAPLSREDVAAAGRAAYKWLALGVRADPDQQGRAAKQTLDSCPWQR